MEINPIAYIHTEFSEKQKMEMKKRFETGCSGRLSTLSAAGCDLAAQGRCDSRRPETCTRWVAIVITAVEHVSLCGG